MEDCRRRPRRPGDALVARAGPRPHRRPAGVAPGRAARAAGAAARVRHVRLGRHVSPPWRPRSRGGSPARRTATTRTRSASSWARSCAAPSGRSVGTILRELAGPLGADVFIGLPDDEHARVVRLPLPLVELGGLRAPTAERHQRMLMLATATSTRRGFSGVGVVNTPRVAPGRDPLDQQPRLAPAAWPASTPGSSTATCWRRRRSPPCAVPRADGHDLVLDRPSRFGAGFQLPQPERPFGTGPRAFGHFGAGGPSASPTPTPASPSATSSARWAPAGRTPATGPCWTPSRACL